MKGAYVLEMLRLLMEDPRSQNPDARFMAMMQDFVSSYSGKNPSSEEFRQVAEKHFGQTMDWFFNEWVYGTEIPHYDFNYQLKPGDGGKTVLEASITQSGVSDQFFMKVPLYVFVEGQPRRLGLLTVKGSTTAKAEVPLPFRPEKVTADEFHSILCTMKQ
jgi:aminopeptidase N